MPYDIVCLCHLRWDGVHQRPHHLMTRFARDHRVVVIEEPIYHGQSLRLEIKQPVPNLWVVTPWVPDGLPSLESDSHLEKLIDQALRRLGCDEFVLWYETPSPINVTRQLRPLAVVFDVMDELSAFRFAPASLKAREAEVLERADVVFTGGQSLYELKRTRHPRVHLFPSSVDVQHFAQARTHGSLPEPADQQSIPSPRLGFFGVLDERLDQELLDGIAHARPDWQLVMIGPVAKIDPAALPRHDNIHYLGRKEYAELPRYIAGWDVALLPFARNDSTRYISPTKTPEYLAAGRPVVSTSITDVVSPYGDLGLVRIAESVESFVAAVEAALAPPEPDWLARVDRFLHGMSWDRTQCEMQRLIDDAVERNALGRLVASTRAYDGDELVLMGT